MVYKLRRAGELPAVKVGSLIRFHPDAVRAYQRDGDLVRGLRRIRYAWGIPALSASERMHEQPRPQLGLEREHCQSHRVRRAATSRK